MLSLSQNAELKIVGDEVIEGFQTFGRDRGMAKKLYFHSEFSRPVKSYGSWTGKEVTPGEKEKTTINRNLFFLFDFKRRAGTGKGWFLIYKH